MNRTQYNQARKMLRENGRIAYDWLEDDIREVMLDIATQDSDPYDDIIFFHKMEGENPLIWLRIRAKIVLGSSDSDTDNFYTWHNKVKKINAMFQYCG